MAFDERYLGQVRLLVAVLPFVAKEDAFALKGGTAINLFIRDMPLLSVDIDLTYLPVEDRDTSLARVEKALRHMATSINLGSPNPEIAFSPKKPLARFDVSLDGTVKVEVNPVLRGCLFPAETRAVTASVEETAEKLPPLQWKLMSLRKMPKARHANATGRLEHALGAVAEARLGGAGPAAPAPR